MKGKYSPLKEKPLRVPGQSTDEAIENLLAEEWTTYFVYVITFFVIAILEWIRSLTVATFYHKLYNNLLAVLRIK